MFWEKVPEKHIIVTSLPHNSQTKDITWKVQPELSDYFYWYEDIYCDQLYMLQAAAIHSLPSATFLLLGC